MGIGRALAFECARRHMNLVLVALENDLLKEAKIHIQNEYSVDVQTLAIDLTTSGAAEKVVAYCNQMGIKVNILMNNAGLGDGGRFESIPLKKYHTMLDLNNRALVDLTFLFLPELQQHTPSAILNTSSIEATLPLPYKAVYTASKNFIYTFSLALNEELRVHGVHVTALCPGPVPTNKDNLKRFLEHGWRARLIGKLPEEVAKSAVAGLLKGKRVVVPGVINRIILLVMHFLPLGWKMRVLERIFRVYRDHHRPSVK